MECNPYWRNKSESQPRWRDGQQLRGSVSISLWTTPFFLPRGLLPFFWIYLSISEKLTNKHIFSTFESYIIASVLIFHRHPYNPSYNFISIRTPFKTIKFITDLWFGPTYINDRPINCSRRTLVNLWALLLDFAHLPQTFTVRWPSSKSTDLRDFARRPLSEVNARRCTLKGGFETSPKPRVVQWMESLLVWGIPLSPERWCGMGKPLLWFR